MKMQGIRKGMRGLANARTSVVVLVAGLCVFWFSNQSGAAVLATGSTHSLGYAGSPSSVCFQFGQVSGFDVGFPIFENLALTPADVGQTFVVNALNDPDFNGLVGVLTNGTSDYLKEEIGSFGGFPVFGLYLLESDVFGNIAGSPAADFHGYSIDSISLTVNQLTTDGNVSFEGTITVEGTAVPEPGTIALTTLGFLALIVSSYTFRQSRKSV